jgi:hypothetical protein
MTISRHLLRRQFAPIAHHCQTKTTPRFPFLSSPTFVIGDPSWPWSFPTFLSGNHLLNFQSSMGFRPHTPRPFCFGKRTQNHVGRGVALRVALCGSPTPAARKLAKLKQCAPSLQSQLHCLATPQGQEAKVLDDKPTHRIQTRPA